uniref:Reverse transcriptase domain-containing protein n=1 Tax=Nothobranchius furzeri TaxID=105023 RepID=A0A8C6NVZ4_NOTFU
MLVKKEINNILRRQSEFTMYKTRQVYYFQSARPSHLLALKLKSDEYFSEIFCVRTADGTIQTDAKAVNSTFASFYHSLYRPEESFVQPTCDSFLNIANLPCLTEDESADLELAISLQECELALKAMNMGKSPGPDGIPPEVYRTFWPLLGPLMLNMIQFSISAGNFHRDVNTALISLLLKKGKDPMECSSYRPISLLNADIKIYAKALATRMLKCITKLVHCDQTGFIPSRLASDNVRRLLHVIDKVQDANGHAAVLSLDAMKAFDRLEWPFLWALLKHMGFGPSYITMIKVLYKGPSAAVVTGRSCSSPFPVSRGSRQGCPLSPLLFALSMEPLAQVLGLSNSFSPIVINNTQHRVSLYADDLLLYIDNPVSCMHNILSIFSKYGEVSGFKINWQKSALMWLSRAPDVAQVPLAAPVVEHFTYLGIDIYPSISNIIKYNFEKTLTKLILDLEKWAKFKNSLCSRVSVIKMNILPRVNFISSMIPLPPPRQYWAKLQAAITKYVWNGKRPRIKIQTMQRERKDGGLSLPDFKLYNRAFTLRPLSVWFQTDVKVSWRELEESLVSPHSLHQILHLYPMGSRSSSYGQIITYMLKVWEIAGKLCGGLFPWDPGIPLFGNKRLQIDKQPLRCVAWDERGISVLGDIFGADGLLSFAELCAKINLPRTTFYCYLQLRSVLKALGVPLQGSLPSLPVKKLLCTQTNVVGYASKLYKVLLHSLYRPLALESLWKADFSDLNPDLDWCRLWENVGLSSRNPDHQQIHYNFIHRLYLTPKKLHAMKIIRDPNCKLCDLDRVGTFKHMFWECPPVMDFWRQVAGRLSALLGCSVPCLAGVLILNDFSQIKLKVAVQRVLLAGLTAAKKMVATRWKPPHCLSVYAWTTLFLDIAYLELSVARVHRAGSATVEAWRTVIDHLRTNCESQCAATEALD